eukprot:scaffold647927_cov42-Prasinocladus_malaysianus.AAC.2
MPTTTINEYDNDIIIIVNSKNNNTLNVHQLSWFELCGRTLEVCVVQICAKEGDPAQVCVFKRGALEAALGVELSPQVFVAVVVAITWLGGAGGRLGDGQGGR